VRLRLSAGLVSAAVTAAIPIAAATSASAAAKPGPDTLVKVQQDITAKALPQGSPFGTTPSSTPETVSFVLRANGLGTLEAKVANGGFTYPHFLTVSQFTAEYGQPGAARALTSYLARFGITTSAYADNLDVTASGTAGEFDSALAMTGQEEYKVPELKGKDGSSSIPAQTVHSPKSTPELPEYLASDILAVLGLTNYSPLTTQTAKIDAGVVKPQAGSSNSCLALSGLPDACNLPSSFAAQYNLDPLYKKADGSGQTIAIVTLAALDQGTPGDLSSEAAPYFWQNISRTPQTGRTLSVDNVDGGPGAPSDASGTGETDLDVEQSGALAPGANVVVYQAPNTDYGFADAYFAAASQNIASSVSASWAESETYLQWAIAAGEESPGYEAAFDEVFCELAAQGQSAFTASGDWSAYGATVDLGSANLAVETSGSSPYITDAGGTTNPWSGTLSNSAGTVTANVDVPAQRTWSWNYLWGPVATVGDESYAASALSQITGSGGGFSSFEPRPSYQYDVPGMGNYDAYNLLTPADYAAEPDTPNFIEPTQFTVNSSPTLTHGYNGFGRAVPDVSANADPYSGYLLYEPSFAGVDKPVLQGGWGGTSFVGPQLNGSTAEIDSYLGHRVGFWNPSVYAYAASGRDPFTPLNAIGASNNNLYYTGNPGSLFNEGSGLGVPNLTALATDFGSSHGSGHKSR
jgi:subtilase family serine protease